MKISTIIKILILFSITFANPALAGSITGNFFPATNSTLAQTATTSSQFIQFTTAAQVGASDVMIANAGIVGIYCDIGTGGAAFITTVPTNTVAGGMLINPSEVRIFNKRANDTVSCITSSSTALFSATPGIGH